MIDKIIDKLKLRDPIWQALGVFLGLIALIVSTFVAYNIYFRSKTNPALVILEVTQFDPLWFRANGENLEVSLIIGNKKAESVAVYYYSIANRGTEPIKPEDFVRPLRVTIGSPWRLLYVDSERSYPWISDVYWNRVNDNTFEMQPTLLNPGDATRVLIFAETREKFDKTTIRGPSLEWAARITNISHLIFEKYESQNQTPQSTVHDWYLFFTCLLFAVLYGVTILHFQKKYKIDRFSMIKEVLVILNSSKDITSARIKFIDKFNISIRYEEQSSYSSKQDNKS